MKETSFANYADDNAPYVTAKNLGGVKKIPLSCFSGSHIIKWKQTTINVIFWLVVKIM